MATVDLTTGGPVGIPALRDNVAVMEARIDFSKTNLPIADIALVLSIPAKSLVIGVQIDSETAADTGVTLAAGDFQADGTPIGATAYLAAAAADAVASRFSGGVGSAETNALGKYYAADAKIGITGGGAEATEGIVHVRVYLADLAAAYRGIGGS